MDMPATTAGLQTGAVPSRGFLALLRTSISAHAIYWAIIIVYYAGFLMLLRLRPDIEPASFLLMALGFIFISMPFMFFGLAIMRFYHIARHVRPERPIAALSADLKRYVTDRRRLAHGLPMVVVMMLFMYVFVQLKASIPLLNPFAWDTAFADLDKALHFGHHPWELMQPVFGYAPVSFLININYNAWFAAMWMVWVFFAFSEKTSEIRTRFFLTYFIVWIVGGSLLAIYYASAGPAFYGRLGLAPDPYAGLMAYLHAVNDIVPVWAVNMQDFLWQGYVAQSPIEGISGMPSMHNGSALLFALAVFRVNRAAGWVLTAHALFIFLGSVHLAWHYAVDAYLAWALTYAVWLATGPVARWWEARPETRALAAAMGG
jgi:hypothetical protein